ncbi:MAG: hypothetical protein ACN2B6_02790 [Rickettsiales bacterium]
MKASPKILISALIVVLLLGYSIMWFVQADKLKGNVEKTISMLNEKETYITYESIDVAGFPMKMAVVVSKPRFAGRVDVLLKSMDDMHVGTKKMFPELPEWQEDTSLDGTLTIQLNALSDEYGIILAGDWHNAPTIDGQKLALTSKVAGDFVCDMKLANSKALAGAIWTGSIERDGKQFMKDLRVVDCSFPAYEAINVASSEVGMKSEGGYLKFNREPSGDTQSIYFAMKMDNVEFTETGDRWMELYKRAFPQHSVSQPLSTYGKQNVDIELSFNGPEDFKDAKENAPLDVNLNKFIINNAIYNVNVAMQAKNTPNGDQRAASLVLKADSSYSEEYDNMVQRMARNAIDELYANKDELTTAYLEKYTADEMYSIVFPALPNMHPLGKMVQNLDVSYQGSSDFKVGNATLTAFELSAAPYGVTGKGTANMSQDKPFPAADLSLTCSNCARLIDDITDYVNRVSTAFAYFEPEALQANTMNPQLVEAYKNFLSELSVPSQDDTDRTSFNYAIVSDGMMGVTINGKPMNEVMSLYAQHIGNASMPASGEEQPDKDSN